MTEWDCFLISLLVVAHHQYNRNRPWVGTDVAAWTERYNWVDILESEARNKAWSYKWRSWV